MPDKNQVWMAADEVRRSGESVSQKSVLRVLRTRWRGGSTRDVGPHLLEWKAARNYQPRLEVNDIPDRLKGDLMGFVRGVWDAASVEASQRLEDDRARLASENQAARELMDEAYVEAEVATRENEVLKARVRELEDEVVPLRLLRAEVAALRTRVEDLVAAEFWDRVMRAIEEVLPPDVWVPDREILQLLPSTLAREAITYGEPLTRGTLNKKMSIRVTHKKYFEFKKIEAQDGGGKRYRRRTS